MKLYNEKAEIYDKFIRAVGKDYSTEAKVVIDMLGKNLGRKKITILDLGCGTGGHAAEFLKEGFQVFCGDKSKQMLRIAKQKTSARCIELDMKNFVLDENVDTITCLFNTISYNKNEEELENTFTSCFRNLKDGGLLVLEITNPKLLEKAQDFSKVWDIGDNQLMIQIDCMNLPLITHYFVMVDTNTHESLIDKHDTVLFPMTTITEKLLKVGFINIEILEKNSQVYISCRKTQTK